ncbi:unnamed protein product [Lathyrus oleraceus]
MATSMNSREFVILIIVLTLLVVKPEARLVPMLLSTKDKVVHVKFGLREVINDVKNSEWLRKRAMLGGRPERVSPGGPDAQHH